MATINIRIDTGTKNKAQEILGELGLDLSSAIKIFLNKVILTESIPFELNIKKIGKKVDLASIVFDDPDLD